MGMQEHISMCIVSVDSKCYDSSRACRGSKLSDTEEVSSMSFRYPYEVGLRLAWSRYTGRYCCVNSTTTSQQLLEIAKVRGLALVRTEERNIAINQVRVKDNQHLVGNGSQVVTILDWMVPGICSRCVAMRPDLQGIHEDHGGMFITPEMGQRVVHLEAASKINDRKILDKSVEIMDKTIKWLRTQDDKDGLGAMKVCASKYHKYLVTSCDYSKKGKCRVMIRD
jgi:hypothetical protein